MKDFMFVLGIGLLAFNAIYCEHLKVVGWPYFFVLSSAIVGSVLLYKGGKL